MINSLIDFNGMSNKLVSFYGNKISFIVHCVFIGIVFKELFADIYTISNIPNADILNTFQWFWIIPN